MMMKIIFMLLVASACGHLQGTRRSPKIYLQSLLFDMCRDCFARNPEHEYIFVFSEMFGITCTNASLMVPPESVVSSCDIWQCETIKDCLFRGEEPTTECNPVVPNVGVSGRHDWEYLLRHKAIRRTGDEGVDARQGIWHD